METTSTTADNGSLLSAALDYARRGWAVFPLRPGGKEPLTPHGFKEATHNEEIIRDWWTQVPDAGIGGATGRLSGIVVLDCDPRNGGDDSLKALRDEHGDFPATPQALTGGGGLHVVFRCPEAGFKSMSNMRSGIDVKADGGYVVLPPSRHPSGTLYAWAPGKSLADIEPAPLPEWLAALAACKNASPEAGRRVLSDETIQEIADILAPYWQPNTARHELAKGIAGYLAMQGAGRGDAEALIGMLTENDEERKDRFIAVRDSWRRARDGQPVKGRTTLVEVLGLGAADRIADIVKRGVGEASRAPADAAPVFATVRTLGDRRSKPLVVPDPLIQHLVWPKTVAMLFGPTGVGKSTFLVQLALVAAMGRYPRHEGSRFGDLVTDLPCPSRSMRVLYVGPEDSPEMFESMKLPDGIIAAFNDVPDDQFLYVNQRITLAARAPQPVDLQGFVDYIRAEGDRGPIDLVILDPLKRFHTLDENDNSDMGEVMAAIDSIRTETGAAVIFSHHTGKQAARLLKSVAQNRADPTQARGASVLSDQSHVVISLVKGKGKTVVLTWAKSNYAPLRPPMVLERTEGGLLVPVHKHSPQLEAVVEIVRENRGAMPRAALVKDLAQRRHISDRNAREWVGKAEETWRLRRVNKQGDLDDSGEYVAVDGAA